MEKEPPARSFFPMRWPAPQSCIQDSKTKSVLALMCKPDPHRSVLACLHLDLRDLHVAMMRGRHRYFCGSAANFTHVRELMDYPAEYTPAAEQAKYVARIQCSIFIFTSRLVPEASGLRLFVGFHGILHSSVIQLLRPLFSCSSE